MNKYFYPIFKLPTFYERDYVKEELPLWIKWWLLGKAGRELSEILTGSEFTLLHTLNRKFKILQINGRTEQEQLRGKNLFNNNSSTIFESMASFTKIDNVLRIAIEQNLQQNKYCYVVFPIQNFNELLGKTITLSASISPNSTNNGRCSLYYCGSDGVPQTSLGSVSSTGSTTIEVGQSIPAGSTQIALLLYANVNETAEVGDYVDYSNIQLEFGSTATSYEPYCGGIPSPNPDFPQQIKNVTGNANVKIQNKNLLNETTFITGKALNIADGSLQDASDRMTSDFIEVKPNINYICNKLINRFVEYDENKQLVHSGTSVDGTPITMKPNAKYFRTTFVIDLTDIQIEQGSTATSYVPHQEQNLPFTFAEGQRAMQGTELKDDGIHNIRSHYIITGNENWSYYSFTSESLYFAGVTRLNNIKYYGANSPMLCNRLSANNGAIYNKTGEAIGCLQDGYLYICLLKEKIGATLESTNIECVELLKQYLATQYQNNMPYEIEYTLIEEETIPYNETQQAQYEAIKQARSYDDITIISSESDELPPLLDIQYWKERGTEE